MANGFIEVQVGDSILEFPDDMPEDLMMMAVRGHAKRNDSSNLAAEAETALQKEAQRVDSLPEGDSESLESFANIVSPQSAFSIEEKREALKRSPIANEEVFSSGHFRGGMQAIEAVEELEGPLNLKQKRVVELEGFVGVPYLDTKGITSYGVGQTGEFIDKTFKESFAAHEAKARDLVEVYDELPENVQAELVQAAYRGDLQQSPKFRKLLNEKRFSEAAVEFLDHEEFKNPKTPKQIKERILSVSMAVGNLANLQMAGLSGGNGG